MEIAPLKVQLHDHFHSQGRKPLFRANDLVAYRFWLMNCPTVSAAWTCMEFVAWV